jgi:hypothetical protein
MHGTKTYYRSTLLALLLVFPASVQAQFAYTTNNGTITITAYTGPGGAVDIPAAIDGLPVTSIGGWAFSYWYVSGVTSATIPDTVLTIGPYAFYYADLTSVSIGSNVTSIGDFAFAYCPSLTNVTIPRYVNAIGSLAFASSYSLRKITVDTQNASYSDINGVLFDKNQMTLIQCPSANPGPFLIPDTTTNILGWAFERCASLTSVTIPQGVKSIGAGTFSSCGNLTNVVMIGGVTSIGDFAFEHCGTLSSITVGNNLSSIGFCAFRFCTDLTSIAIPRGLISIDTYAFFRTGLTNFSVPDTVAQIGAYAFTGCFDLTAFQVDPGNVFYSSIDGVLFDKNQTVLVQYPCGRSGPYGIPAGVTSVAYNAFNGAAELTDITIAGCVTNIGDQAFNYCGNLKAAYFQGNAPTLVGSYSFYTNTTVYYMSGTSGWGSTFGGSPAVLWNPQAQTIGVQSNEFGFNITGTTNIPIVVEAKTNLAGGSWIALLDCTLTNGSVYFSDPQWTNYPSRFYRIRSP